MNDFKCPKCHEHLRVGDQIIFRVKNSTGQSALLLLNPQIGNYSSIKHPSFRYTNGEPLDFYCPVCCSSLKSEIHPNLAHVLMEDESGKVFDVFFSQVAGEQSTFRTDGESVQQEGRDAGRYTYFKIGDKFKRFL
ncbi:MAG: hypothetical protein U0X39_06090 [Bacteroidales bacterium]